MKADWRLLDLRWALQGELVRTIALPADALIPIGSGLFVTKEVRRQQLLDALKSLEPGPGGEYA